MKQKYIIVDVEATGLYPFKHGMTQLSAIVVSEDFEIMAVFDEFVCPPEPILYDPEALKITGMTLEKIRKGKSYEFVAKAFLKFVKKYFGTNIRPIMVGQFHPFDFAFIQKIMTETGNENQYNGFVRNQFLDTKVIAEFINYRAIAKGMVKVFESTSLSSPKGIAQTLGITNTNAHNSLSDCQTTLLVLEKLLKLENI